MKQIYLVSLFSFFAVQFTYGQIYVDINAAGLDDGTSWTNAYNDLQNAIVDADGTPGADDIYVAEGSYFPSVPAGRDATFDFSTDITVYGGFSPANGAIDLATRDFRTYETILDGDLGILGDTSDNAYHVGRTISGSPIIDGLTIQNGNASNNGGGAMTLNGTLVTINNCNFRDNIGINGGAILSDAETIISNSIFTNNVALASGGAVEGIMFGNNLTIENSLFFENTVNGSGGAINLVIFASTSVFTLTNVTLSKNAATGLTGDAITYTNGGASNFTANITNSILWDNDDGDGNDNQIDNGSTTPTTNYTYSLIKGTDLTGSNGLDGTNLANDPQFTDPATNDFTLQPTSPVIDLGDNTAVTQPTDLNGDTRIIDGDNNGTATVDFGAFESPMVVISNIEVTASGDLEFIDNDDRDDNLTIVINGANYRFTDPDNLLTAGLGAIQIDPNTVDVLIASVTGVIRIETMGGDDTVTSDFSGGNFQDLINYNGGTQNSTSPGDILRLQGGGTFASVEHTLINENDGNVAITGNSLISYVGLEPVIDNLSATDRIFSFTGGAETITLQNDATLGSNSIDSTLGEIVTFTNPTNSLTINTEVSGGSGADVVNIQGLDANFDADVTVNGGTDDDANFQTNPTSIGSGSFDINARTISVSQDVSTTLAGSITLNASQNIVADSGAIISAENGNINFSANTAATLAGINTVAILLDNATLSTTGTGNIVMNGVAVGDGTASDRVGVSVTNSSSLQTSGSGSITVIGTGGNGVANNVGVEIQDAGTSINTASGLITINGIGGNGTSDTNTGIVVKTSSIIESLGGGISINGTATNGIHNNIGLQVKDVGTRITGNIVAMDIIGQGASGATGNNNHGIEVSNGGVVECIGSGTLTMLGNGGNGISNNNGMLVADAGTRVTTDSGNLTIFGTGGNGTGTLNDGFAMNNGEVSTAAATTLDIVGTAGNVLSSAVSFNTFDDRIISFGGGDIVITALSGPLTSPSGLIPAPPFGSPFIIGTIANLTINGEVQAGNNATGPGQLAILAFNAIQINSGNTLTIQINGFATPGVDYGQLLPTGQLDITNTNLNLVDGLAGPVPNGTTITLIANDGVPVIGTFNGLPEGAILPFNGQDFVVSYIGGSGSNDVVLTENSLCAAFPANIVYVDQNATGSNDGTSWANAFTDLQDAIIAINSCPALDTIYVAEGTYFPTTSTDRTISFTIPGNTTVYGGFSPTNGAIDLGTRDFNAYPTILSGDIGVAANQTDNAYHVVYIEAIASPIIIDGFTIRDGYVNLSQFEEPFFAKRSGAGVLIETYAGGANLTINNCILTDNESTYAAGALANTRQDHTIVINNSSFSNNAGGFAGAIFFRGDEVITISNTSISNNTGDYAIFLLAPLNLTIDNCLFDTNVNALDVRDTGTSRISNSIFRNHNSTLDGAIRLISANMIIENSLFYDNAAARGGAIYTVSSSLEIIGSTFTRNTASNNNFGEAIYVDNSAISTLNITNSILWDNDDGDGIDDEISSDGAITGDFNHSLIKGFDLTASNGLDGTNPANDPLFTNPATNDFTVQTASPVIDLGDNTVVTEPNDLNGNTRIVDGDSNTTVIVDFGAYEAPELPDTTPPVITCPADISGDCAINPIAYPFPTATDNIGVTPATPAGFQFLGSKNGKSYFLSDGLNDGPSSFANAISLGGSVAAIVDEETKVLINQAVEAIAPGLTYYIGLNDVTTEGTYQWQSGVPFVYENWLVGEPNGGVPENYVAMRPDGFWVDIGAAFVSRYVLELTGGIEQIAGLPSGFNFPVGTTTNTFLATDTSGNTDTCSFDITITDSTPVTITCPADITTNNDPGLCGAYVNYPFPLPNEDCNQTNPLLLSQVDEIVNLGFDCVDFISSHVRIFDLAAEGVTNDYFINTIRVGIAFANPAENVTVNIYLDSQLPNAITSYNSPLSDHVPPYATNTVASPAANATILEVPINVFIPSDATVIVEVVTPETANFLMGYLNNNASETAVGYIGCGSFFVSSDLYPAIISVDGSEYLNQTTIQTAGLSPNSLFPVGTTTNTFVVTDANGNTDTCSFNITVNDTELPVLTCPADITVDNDSLLCGAVVDYTVLGSENCISSTIPGFEVIGSSNKKIYYLSDAKFLPPDAFADAVANGGFVVTIEDDVMNSFLFDRVQQMAPNATPIIGYNDIASEGNFVWQSGEPFVYNNWFTSEPNGSTGENHSQLRTDGFWNDISPTAVAYRYILEIDSATLLTQTAGLAAGSEFPVGTTTNTFTYTDPSGNIGTCSFDVTVNDIEAPVAVCQNITIQLDAFGNATIVASDVDGGSTDNCAVTDFQVSQDTFSCADVGTPVNITLTVFDAALNSDSCTATVTVEDVTAPSITCPADQNVDFDASCQYTLIDYTALAAVSDACDPAPVVTQSPPAGTVVSATTTVTLTATDASGNSDSCTFDVIPSDTTPPSVSCPADQTEDLDANCEFILPDYTGLAFVIDDCDTNPVLSQSPTPGTVITAATVVTIFAEDANGNIGSCTFNVTLVDITPPVISCPADQNVDFDASCQYTLLDYTALATVNDTCDPAPVVTQSPPAGTVISATTTITLTATDANGNTDSCTFDVIPADTTPPTISCPADQNVDFDPSCQYTLLDYTALATANDACDPTPVIIQSPPAGTVISATTTITLTATDASGNSDSCTFEVIPSDTTPPSVSCPADQTESLDANCEFVLPDYTGLAIVLDNCDANPLLSQNPTPGTVITAATVVTIFAEDIDGNIGSCTFSVTPVDTTPPTISCPADQNVDFDASCQYTLIDYTALAAVSDACDPAPVVTQSPPAGTVISATTTVTLTATDATGNSESCTFDVIPVDTTPPSVSCPADQTETLDANCEFVVPDYTGLAFVIDNCDANPLLSQSPSPGTVITVATVVTIFAEDADGNTDSCTFNVTLIDTTPPVISCPATQNENADASCMFTLPDYTGLATATDNCGTVSITQSPAPGTVVGQGTTTITLEASDGTNTSNCSFDVVVADTTPPMAVCQNATVQLDAAGSVVVTPADVDNGSFDNCSAVSLSVSPNTFTCAEAGTTQLVTLTATDASGNSSSCTAMVTIEDSVPPTAICQDISIVLDAGGNATITASDVDGGSTDACGIASLSVSQTMFGCDDVGANDVILTVTDVNGNSSTCVAVVTVSEAISPVAVCQDITVQLDALGMATITGADVDGGSTDNCAIDSTTLSTTTFDCNDIGPNMVTLTVFDASGNSDSCMAIVTVEDTVAPDAICQDITIALDAMGMATITPADVDGGSTDACGIASLSIDINMFDCSNVGPNNVTLTVIDVNGNESSCVAIVTVEEENAIPVAVCQNITVPLGLDGTATITPNSVNAGSTGAGCTNGLSLDIDTFDCNDVAISPIMVTLTVTNGNGTTDSCTAFVNVVDTLDPIITCPADQQVTSNGPYVLPDYVASGDVFVTDNCGTASNIEQEPAPGTLLEQGEYNISFTATDPSANEASCFFRLTVDDLLGTTDVASMADVTIYPNPAQDFFLISNPFRLELVTIQVYDMTGRLVIESNLDNRMETKISIVTLQSASYLVVISSEREQLTKQLIKE